MNNLFIFYWMFSALFMIGQENFKNVKGKIMTISWIIILASLSPLFLPIYLGSVCNKIINKQP